MKQYVTTNPHEAIRHAKRLVAMGYRNVSMQANGKFLLVWGTRR